MARSPGRRRPLPRDRSEGGYSVFMGPTARDGVTAFVYPQRFMVRQRGVLVHRLYSLGGRDKPDRY